jgi:hypothetical protein
VSGKIGPDLIADPGLGFVTDPARFARENKSGLAYERKKHVHVAMNNFEAGHVEGGAFKTGILIAANDKRIKALLLHGGTHVIVAAFDFALAWQRSSPEHAEKTSSFLQGLKPMTLKAFAVLTPVS